MEKWNEKLIARRLALHVFDRKHLVIVPNCSWPGSECDLLVVTPNLRVIDVEIKISRSDLKADAKKDKWFHNWDFRIDGPYHGPWKDRPRRKRDWPQKVWKHYYCLPREIWDDSLAKTLATPMSGVLLMYADQTDGELRITVARAATPCRQADRISPEDAIDIARLASLRMWDAINLSEQKK